MQPEGWYRDPFRPPPGPLVLGRLAHGARTGPGCGEPRPAAAQDYEGALTEIEDTAVNGEDLRHTDNPAWRVYDAKEMRWVLRHGYPGWVIGTGAGRGRTY